MRRRDLHTVLPRHVMTNLNQSPRLSKTNSVDEKPELDSGLKRQKSNSVSSEAGNGIDFDSEVAAKRPKLEQIDELNDESSPKPSDSTI
jgi:hypothetical protein